MICSRLAEGSKAAFDEVFRVNIETEIGKRQVVDVNICL